MIQVGSENSTGKTESTGLDNIQEVYERAGNHRLNPLPTFLKSLGLVYKVYVRST